MNFKNNKKEKPNEKKLRQNLPSNDSFLTSIRRQIRMLGFAAVGSLLFVGLTAMLTLWRSNSNNSVLNYMNLISGYQYEIDIHDEETFDDSSEKTEILTYLRKMQEAALSASELVYASQTKNNILTLSKDIDHLRKNYDELFKISEKRGYDTSSGLYAEYIDAEYELYSLLLTLQITDDEYPDPEENYAETFYQLNQKFSDYTSGIISGKNSAKSGWGLYSIYRSFERSLLLSKASSAPSYAKLLTKAAEARELLTDMISLDGQFVTISENNSLLFSHLLTITDRVRAMEERNTSTEQRSLLLLMFLLMVVLIIYMLIHTYVLRRDLSRSIQVFNELMVVKASNDAQSSFLSTVSHEIRTPINAIMGMNEIIIRESKDKQIERYAREIKDSSRTLLSLVNDLLDSSRLDADRLKIIPVEYDLSSSISDLVNMIRSRANDKNLAFHVNVDENIPHMLFGDEIRVKQCVLNLLTNAVKYTEVGSITLNVDYEAVNRGSIQLRFQVIDTGIGMKEEDLSRLYERFARFEEKKNRNIEGTGLGMNIVKRLLALMGSDLEVHSIYGKGSDFSFSVHQGVIDWEPIGDYNSMYERALQAENSYREKLRAPAARILIVDDMKVNLTVFKGLLKKTDIQIDTALSGKASLELIKKNSYDMVFLDHRMPKMDGIETLISIKELKNNPNRNIPYIALTANAISGARELYINAGFTDYLSKPIDSDELEDILIEYLPKDLIELSDYDETNDTRDVSTYDDGASDGLATGETVMGSPADSSGQRGSDGNTESYEEKLHRVLSTLEDIDYKSAIENCIDDETLAEALSDFIQSIETKPDEIKSYWKSGDYRNYTIQVHGLKSTARLVGATELSEEAYYLEQCGDAENSSEIDAKTDALLARYTSYLEKLRPFIALNGNSSTADSESSDEEDGMDVAMFADALSSVKELVDSFDFGNAEELLKMLKDYHLSKEQQKKYDTLYKLIRDVDRDAVLKYFDEMM